MGDLELAEDRGEAGSAGAGSGMLSGAEGAPAACPTCGGAGASPSTPALVYAVGKIEPRFSSPTVEREFAQAAAREETGAMTDRQVLHAVLGKRENRYLVRHMGWVFSVQGLETYLLLPRDPADWDLLPETIQPAGGVLMNAAIGVRGPIAPPHMGNGLAIPILAFDQIYSFDRASLIASIPRPESAGPGFAHAAEELLDRVLQLTDNAGATDEHRAVNYLAMRYPAIYARTAEAFARGCALSAVETRPSPLSAHHRLVDVVLSYRDRKTDFVEKYLVRVDVSGEFPFLVTKLQPYFDR
jgi:hypothetical protein